MRKLLFFLLILGTFVPFACTAQELTLAQCIQIGLQQNPSLLAAKYKASAAEKDVKIARADFFPHLSSSAAYSRIDSSYAHGPTDTDYINQDILSANIKLSQILYAGSRLVNTYDRARYLEQANQAETQLAKMDLTYKIETTFYRVMKAKQDVLVSQESVDRLQKNVQVAEAFLKKELVASVEVLKARVDLDDANNQLSIAKNNENRERVTLFSLMNLPPDAGTFFIEETIISIDKGPSFDECYQLALEQRPDLQSLMFQKQAAYKQSEVALGKYLPVVRLEGGFYDQDTNYDSLGNTGYSTYDRDQTNQYWMAGISLSWDLFDGGSALYESQKSDIDASRFGALIRDAQNTLATEIRKSLFSLSEAEQRLKASGSGLTAAQENYSAEENRLKAGVSTMTDVLNAQSRLVRAQVNQANATLDYQVAKSELKFLTGSKKSWSKFKN
ncbi:MAG: TolC family protein [Desulfobulbus sp.]